MKTATKRDIRLVLIDCQNDFCDLPDSWLPTDPLTGKLVRPALPVPGAHQDMLRLAAAVERGIDGIRDIVVTLDSHHFVGIERTTFWRRGDGSDVPSFTVVTEAQVRSGEIVPRNPALLDQVLAYLRALADRGRYQLILWPVHCEIGTWGHGVHPAVRAAYNRWEARRQTNVSKVTKGSNPMTEHYSFLSAEVPDPKDPTTQINRGFISHVSRADRIYIAGEAGSHCVKSGVEDMVENFGAGSLDKLVLVTDCMSPVQGFDKPFQDFLADMVSRGLRLCTADEMAADLVANSLA